MKTTAISLVACAALFAPVTATTTLATTETAAITTATARTATAATPGTAAGELTILATTDLHGTVLDYDYYAGTEFGATKPENARGMEHLVTAINAVRSETGANSVALLDNGDANQGNALESVYHAGRTSDTVDPMASVFNALSYDAGVVGNHEYNYGLDDLAQYESKLVMPLLGANVIEDATGKPYHEPWTMIHKTTTDGTPVDIGVIGVVTPGVSIWDHGYVDGVLTFEDPVLAVQKWVPEVEAAGADMVVVLAHTGLDPANQVWDPNLKLHDVGQSIAENTAGVDLIIGGHSHSTSDVQNYFTNAAGEPVLWSQPGYHARFLSDVTVPFVIGDDGEPTVNWSDTVRPTAVEIFAADQPTTDITNLIEPWHSDTLDWIGQVVAQATETMPGATSVYEDTPILDFVGHVLTGVVEESLVGTNYEGVPVLAQTSPFSRDAVFPEGEVTVANMAGLYTFDNTLLGVELTGAQVRDYLEKAAEYYVQVPEGTELVDGTTADGTPITNAFDEVRGRDIPDYALDHLTGINYHIDISQPAGQRIDVLTHPDGTPVAPDDRFILAINNYRQGGGQNYPHVVDAPIVYQEEAAIREMMIRYALETGIIDPQDFFVENWSLSAGPAVVEEPVTTAEPTVPPTAPAPVQTAEPSETSPAEPVTPTAAPAPSELTQAPIAQPATEPASEPTAQAEALAYTGASAGNIFLGMIALMALAGGGLFLAARSESAR